MTNYCGASHTAYISMKYKQIEHCSMSLGMPHLALSNAMSAFTVLQVKLYA